MPPSPPNAHAHPPNPHRIPRAKGTEQLEQSVPSVLDSAAAILANIETEDVASEVAVVSPANSVFESMLGRSSGFASPIGSFRSRSPSPLGTRAQPGQGRAEILLSIPVSPQAPQSIASPTSILGLQNMTSPVLSPPALSPASASRPTIQTTATATTVTQVSGSNSATPAIVTPTSAYFSTASSVADSVADSEGSPTTTTVEHHPANAITSPGLSPLNPPTSSLASSQSLMSSPISSPSLAPTNLSHPPSPVHVARKRLSFMSYQDLITSTPATTQTLTSLTTAASSMEPPPHIPSVSGLNIASAAQAQHGGSAAPSLHGFSMMASGGVTHPGKRDSIALLDNAGGEWEREGLGRGLEERLDALVIPTVPAIVPVGGRA